MVMKLPDGRAERSRPLIMYYITRSFAHSSLTFIHVILTKTVPGLVLRPGDTNSNVAAAARQHCACQSVTEFHCDTNNGGI